jgi:hypothetical protein
MGGICSTHGRDKKCIYNFGWKTWRQDTNQLEDLATDGDDINMDLDL